MTDSNGTEQVEKKVRELLSMQYEYVICRALHLTRYMTKLQSDPAHLQKMMELIVTLIGVIKCNGKEVECSVNDEFNREVMEQLEGFDIKTMRLFTDLNNQNFALPVVAARLVNVWRELPGMARKVAWLCQLMASDLIPYAEIPHTEFHKFYEQTKELPKEAEAAIACLIRMHQLDYSMEDIKAAALYYLSENNDEWPIQKLILEKFNDLCGNHFLGIKVVEVNGKRDINFSDN